MRNVACTLAASRSAARKQLRPLLSLASALFAVCSGAHATTFTFDTPPFAGTPVLTAPGRQIVGGELFINFSTSSDVFALDSAAFGLSGPVHFVNAGVSNLPSSGVNVVVLETFDDDNDPLSPFGAGNAANLIASKVTTPGPGFFIYFNESLNLPRLVYSTDLSSTNSDLKILARMLNLFGAEGQNALPSFTAANFAITSAAPEPSNLALIVLAAILGAGYDLLRRRGASWIHRR